MGLVTQALFTHWAFDAQIWVGVVLAALLYWRGRRMTATLLPRTTRWGYRPLRAAAFYVGLFTVLVALQSPVDYYSQFLMWMHMVQHLLLILVAAPLLLVGDPAIPFLRALPLTWRRQVIGAALAQPWVHRLQHRLQRMLTPVVVLGLYCVNFWMWHFNTMYNLTLTNRFVHDLEHGLMFGTGLLFWAQVIDQHPFHCRMTYLQRTLYTFAAMVQNHLLALYFVFMQVPLYSVYAHELNRPGGIGVITDQQYAGGIMWVPGMLLYGTIVATCLYQWLAVQEKPDLLLRRRSLITGRVTMPGRLVAGQAS